MNNTNNYLLTFPPALKENEQMYAIAAAVANQMEKTNALLPACVIYPNIHNLPEMVLDILAYDLHVDWYDDTAPIDLKREVISNCIRVQKKLGTSFAVSKILNIYFRDILVQSWEEYGGEPYHFKIKTTNPDVTGEGEKLFNWLLGAVKRESALLDSVDVSIESNSKVCTGFLVTEHSNEIIRMY